jgi:glycosyltransferase involved in cell wall biosynthesis
VISELGFGGAETVVHDLAVGMAARGHDVRVAALFDVPGLDDDFGDRLARKSIPVHRLGMRHKADMARLFGLGRMIRRERPDVVHAHLWHADVAARTGAILAWPCRATLVSTVHTAERRPVGWRFAFDRLTGSLEQAKVFVSPSVLQLYARRTGVPSAKCSVIPNGIDLSAFAQLPDRAASRKLLGLRTDGPVVGSVARLDPYKGLSTLLSAVRTLIDRWPDASVVIAGIGPEEATLRAKSDSLGLADRVHFVGFQRDVRPVLAAMDTFALPSDWEGLPLATLEAMAAGLPVVVSDVPGNRDLVQDGYNGLLVARGSVTALADAIEQCWKAPALARQLAQQARVTAASFSIAEMLNRYERLYSDLLAGLA